MEPLVTAAAMGLAIGVVLALTGAGAGVLAVPLLVFGLQLPLQQAAPIALAAVGAASAIGAALAFRERILRYRAAGFIGSIGMIVAPFGVAVAQRVPGRPLLGAFGLVLVFIAWRMWHPPPLHDRPAPECRIDPADGRLRWTLPCARALGLTGAAAGFLSGLLGVGGGFVIVPSLLRHSDLALRSVQATSLGVIALVSISGSVAAAWHGTLALPLLLSFAGGAIAALLAVRPLARRAPARALQQAFALLCAGVAVLMLARAAGRL